MANVTGPIQLAAVGTTGNNTGAGAYVGGVPDAVAVDFKVEAIGATPTITAKVQVSLDGAIWFDVPFVSSTADSATASVTVTTVSDTVMWIDMASSSRFFRYVRLVTSANTNVTYSATAYVLDNAG
jgi:hypothetical protein